MEHAKTNKKYIYSSLAGFKLTFQSLGSTIFQQSKGKIGFVGSSVGMRIY